MLYGFCLLFSVSTVLAQFDPQAFTVGLDNHLSVSNATIVPFPVVLTINQNAKVNSGVFTCTETGLYKFQVYSLTNSDTQLFLELYHNDVVVVTLWGYTTSDYAAAGNAVILQLTDGDTVKVMTRDQYAVEIYGQGDEIYTTFTGVQLGSNMLEAPASNSPVAFSVGLDHHMNFSDGSAIVYNKVFVDNNNGYDVSSGIYTVPSSGVYLFHLFSLARQDEEVYQEFYHNNHYVCTIYGYAYGAFVDDGNSVILHLKENDQIRVQAYNYNNLYGDPTEIYSTLSGVQIFTEDMMIGNEYPAVAFSAGLTGNHNYSSGEKVVFDRVYVDYRHTYNHVTGEFVAPVAGVYEFNYHALGQQNAEIWLELYHNYKYVNSLYDHTPGSWATAGNAAVLQLDAGDIIYVSSYQQSNLFGDPYEIYCTFSGYLLHSYENSIGVIGK